MVARLARHRLASESRGLRASMKLALLTQDWSPIIGGISTYVAGLRADLQKQSGLEVTVLANEGEASGRGVVLPGGPLRHILSCLRVLTVPPSSTEFFTPHLPS